jgi:CHAD domain-containing protein
MRVAVRRSRALLRAGSRLIGSDTDALAAELKDLGAVLGAVRDLDVLLARLDEEAGELDAADAKAARSLLRSLRAERTRRRRALLRRLESPRYLQLLDGFARSLDELEPSGADVSLDALAARAFTEARRSARALPKEPSDDELHALRKRGKRARYAAELAGQKRLVKSFKRLQDVLGEHQDAVVAEGRLRELAGGAAQAQALAAGRLVERERERKAKARGAWRKAWRKLERAAT